MRYVVGYVDQEAKKMGIKTLSDLEFERMMKAYGVK